MDQKLATVTETQQIIKRLKNPKAPGIDKVNNRPIKQLPALGILYINLIINACLKLGHFPDRWKHAEVMAIKKPDKPSSSPKSYRPISLLTSLSKILERVILSRLTEHLTANNIIPEQQHGFRNQKSTITQLMRVKNYCQSALRNKRSVGMILMDVEKAYDRIWHDGLIFKLIKINTPKYLILIINSFLRNRTFSVKVDNAASGVKNIKFGLPQGAVLSPTLYNVYTADVPIPERAEIALFADDTAFYYASRFYKQIENELRTTVNRFKKYLRTWKVLTNDDKTQAIFITRRRSRQLPTGPITIGTSNIIWSNNVKYLGVVFDKKITFKDHIKYANVKTERCVRILYSLLNRRSDLAQNNKKILYKVGIRPIMTYAAPVIIGAAKSNLKILQVRQNKILRMILNSHWSDRTTTLHETTGIEYVEQFMNRLYENFQARLVSADLN